MREEWESSVMPTPSRGLVLMLGLLAIMAISLMFFEAVKLGEVKK